MYDVLVIGAGPAGWSAALQASKLGLAVGLVEKNLMLGGACVHTGTLPSKSLRHVILQLVALRRAAHLGVHSTLLRPLRITDLMNPTASVIEAHERTIRSFLERNRVELLPGSASFVAPGEIRVATRLGEAAVRSRHVVIASMRRRGIRLMLGEATRAVRVEERGREPRAAIELDSGRRVHADRLLVAAGRRAPDTAALDLERAGIALDAEGQIKVDANYCTSTAGIYAVGDVVGFPALASTSMHQGRLAVLHAAGRELPPPCDLPLAVYTIPEISAVGRTEDECRSQQIPYEIGVARYAETPRGQILGDVDGMLKLIFRRDDHRLIGIHLIGEDSSELVHAGLIGLYSGTTIDQLASAVFNYPTLSEAYRVAALDGLNRL